MTIRSLFPTRIEVAPLKKKGIVAFNRDLIDVCDSLRLADKTGQRWSARHYPGGYTSSGSHDQMHRISSTFAALEKAPDPRSEERRVGKKWVSKRRSRWWPHN